MNDRYQERDLKARAAAELDARCPRFKERFDLPLLTVFLILSALGTGVIFSIVLWLHSEGELERDVLESLDDKRKLTNIRNRLDTEPILDATWRQADRSVIISRKGGLLHRYEPARRLWRDMKPFSSRELNNNDLVSLRSGYGDPNSTLSGNGAVPDILWAVTGSEGLVRRIKNRWEVVVSDSVFRDSNDNPITQEDLSAAAVNGDKTLVALGTVDKGVGLYRVADRRWFSPGWELPAEPRSVERIVWWAGHFWIGNQRGLYLYTPLEGSATVTRVVDGKIVDMDIENNNAFWVVVRTRCEEDNGKDCVQVLRYNDPQGQPEVLFDQGNIYEGVNLTQLHQAHYRAPELFLAGKPGVYRYNTDVHHWQRLTEREVEASLKAPQGNGFFMGGENWVGSLIDGHFNDFKGPETRPWGTAVSLTPGRGNEALVLTDSNFVISVSPGGANIVFRGDRSKLRPKSMTRAVAMNDDILFTGTSGALLHNTRSRDYINLENPPAWLVDKGHTFKRSPPIF